FVTNMELHGLPWAYVVANCDCAAIGVDADHVADEKIALLESLLIFADDAADVQRLLDQPLLACWQRIEDFAELDHRGFAAQLVDDIPLGLGHHKRPANGAATLGDDRLQSHRAADVQGDGALDVCGWAEHQAIFAGLCAAAGHAADHGHFGTI